MGVWLNFAGKGRATLSPVHAEICEVGFELLFNVDSLKEIAEDPRSNLLFDNLRSHITSSPSHLISALPILMTEFINTTKKHRSLFSTGGPFAVDAHSSTVVFFSLCEDILRVPGLPQAQVWCSRLDLLKVTEEETIFSSEYEHSVVLLKQEVEASVECLASTDGEPFEQRSRVCRLIRYQMRISNQRYNVFVCSPASTIALWKLPRVVSFRCSSPSFGLFVKKTSQSQHMSSFLLPFRITQRPARCLYTYLT